MKNIKQILNEKLLINKNSQKNNNPNHAEYASNWQWFNNLITNVELNQEQLEAMFWNLSDKEVEVWCKEIQDCYSGADTEAEKDAMEVTDRESMAYFYNKYPIKD